MSRRTVRDATYRERWIDAVLWNDELTPMTKNVLLAMSRHMDERGRVRRKHADLAQDLQIKNPKHIGDRIREARDKQFLSQLEGTGLNRTVSAYDAMIPARERSNAPQSPRARVSHVPGNGGRENGGREPAREASFTSRETGDHYARATKTSRGRQPAPDGSREEREHDATSQAGNYRSWLPTPVGAACSDPRTEVA